MASVPDLGRSTGKKDASFTGYLESTSDVAFVASGAGAIVRSMNAKVREVTVSPEDFLSAGDDGAAIRAAIAAVIAAGGGTVRFAPRIYDLTTATDTYYCLSVPSGSGLCLVGHVSRTALRVGNGMQRGLIAITDANDMLIDGIMFDGNSDNNTGITGVHGVRVQGANRFILRNFVVRNTRGYGIGFQGGTVKNTVVDSGHVSNTWIDAIDLKNPNDNNESVRFSNLMIEGHGRSLDGTSTGIDIRGPASVVNCYAYLRDLAQPSSGFRTRQDDIGNTGLGGRYASLVGCHVIGPGVGSGSMGFSINAQYTSVVGCSARDIPGPGYHVTSTAKGARVTSSIARSCDRGFWTQGGDRQALTACHAEGMTNEAFRIDGCTNTILAGCVALDSNHGFRQLNASTGVRLVHCASVGNTSTQYSLLSGGARVIESEGYTSTANVVASGLAADSVGDKTFTVAHGLNRTPAIGEVQLTVVQETAVNDVRFGLLRVDTVTSTQVTGRAVVTTASATAGATFGIAVSIRQ